jgi:hypothetical protein
MLVSIKVSNNHLLDCFKAPHVNSNMLDICKPLEIGDFLHLSNNIFHLHGVLIHLKVDPRDKIKCSKFAKKVMYNNFEKKKNSQLLSIESCELRVHIGVESPHKGQRVKGSLLCPTFLIHQQFN